MIPFTTGLNPITGVSVAAELRGLLILVPYLVKTIIAP
jgi:hypothetical protein